MALLIATRLGSSPIHGLGLFAPGPIAAGTPVWRFDDRIDRILYPTDDLHAAVPTFAEFEETYLCEVEGGLLLPGDNARFINHADAPLLRRAVPGDWRAFCAARDIAGGEELTCNYEDICDAVRRAGAAAFFGAAA